MVHNRVRFNLRSVLFGISILSMMLRQHLFHEHSRSTVDFALNLLRLEAEGGSRTEGLEADHADLLFLGEFEQAVAAELLG